MNLFLHYPYERIIIIPIWQMENWNFREMNMSAFGSLGLGLSALSNGMQFPLTSAFMLAGCNLTSSFIGHLNSLLFWIWNKETPFLTSLLLPLLVFFLFIPPPSGWSFQSSSSLSKAFFLSHLDQKASSSTQFRQGNDHRPFFFLALYLVEMKSQYR